MHETLNVLILGGNRAVAQLIVDFTSRAFLNVVGVSDLYDDSPGALVASSMGIPFSASISELSTRIPEPDLIIDMAEWPGANGEIFEAYGGAAGGHPTVIHDAMAKLVLGLAADSSVPAPKRVPAYSGADC